MITLNKTKIDQFAKFKLSNLQATQVKGGTSEVVDGGEAIVIDDVWI